MSLLDMILLNFDWKVLLNPQFYIEHGGLWLLLFVVFAETGLFAGFFLPGDSLLFVAGIYAHEGEGGKPGIAYEFLRLFGMGDFRNEWMDLIVLWLLISLMGILGNMLGFWTGRKIGPTMYTWKDNMLFKKHYLHQAHEFYERNGGGAIDRPLSADHPHVCSHCGGHRGYGQEEIHLLQYYRKPGLGIQYAVCGSLPAKVDLVTI